ncbi:EscU/YscU/HrcU family type III secretion system export apparatus switch protein (plasmid) [Bosea vestrisii]|uniref:EscU/YscU/HrcU family type III secretion system export apparatus switch protein n=1 Tax=Bosea vestrisii TaxID=151416 RepID=UPI0024E02CA6|nr:EscU/YscU/HrcU family type III secretion system export apparatus switch protein [Bosea vestrisii]WID99702.1 EscU/YscU/HrcU family type III secretion system export apparatus switch protein [Bosea vestrisii]
MSDSGEEKKLPPSAKKLRDARKKGQVPRSLDFATAAGTCAGIAWLWSEAGEIEDKWKEALLLADKLQPLSFETGVRQALGILAELSMGTVLPFLGVMVGAGIAASFIANRGLVFSFELVKPKFENINPIEGMKRIFSLRSLIELAKTLFKAIFLGITFLFVVLGMWKTLVYLPVCGMGCIGFVVGTETKLLMGIAAAAFLIAGMLDLLTQRWLFMREMRMTETEAKREFKEQEGNPQLKGEYRRLRQEAASLPPLGMRRATLVLRGRNGLIGLRYVRGETGVPIVVCRGKGGSTDRLLEEARELSVSIVEDDALVRVLLRKAKLGNAIPSQYFQAVAKALYATGQV